MIFVRESVPEDNHELQQLQEQCPQGASLIVSTVNTPDFFARVKAYESYKVYVACDGDRVIGSGACAIRNAVVNGGIKRIGYEFQYFTSPDYRRKSVAKRLHQQIEEHLTKSGAQLSYALIMEGNLPSMRLFENEGFKIHRKLLMPALVVRKEMDVILKGKVRLLKSQDLPRIADLLNTTWKDRELYEPISAETLAQLISRLPAFSYDNLLILEDRGKILACLGCWDWSNVMRVTVRALNRKLKIIGWVLTTARIVPDFPKAGSTMKQMMLTLMGFKDPMHLAVLIRHANNQALKNGIEEIFCICEQDDLLLKSMKGFLRVNTAVYLIIKQLAENISLPSKPVFVNGIDL